MLDLEAADFDLAGVLAGNHPPGWIEPPPPEPDPFGPDVLLGDQDAGPPPPYEPGDPGPDAGPPPRPESGPPAKSEPKYHFQDTTDWITVEPPPIKWLFDKQIVEQTVNILAASLSRWLIHFKILNNLHKINLYII